MGNNKSNFIGRHYKCPESDMIETPYSMTEQLLQKEDFDYSKIFADPCCGKKAISHVLKSKTLNTIESDINTGTDFLNINHYNIKSDYIITNPPFSLWDEFVKKAKDIAKIKFAFLGKLEFLTGITRYREKLFFDRNYNLKKVLIFIRKANLKFFNQKKEIEKIQKELKSFRSIRKENHLLEKLNKIKKQLHYSGLREDGKYPAGMFHYAWYIFENGYIGKPIIEWINNHPYILGKNNE